MQAADISGRAFKNATAILMARVFGDAGVAVTIADIASVTYMASLVDESDPDAREAIEGHDEESLSPADVLFDTLQRDPRWTADTIGYNFLHQPDRSSSEIFATAGTKIIVEYRLTPTDGGQVIVFRFKITVV